MLIRAWPRHSKSSIWWLRVSGRYCGLGRTPTQRWTAGTERMNLKQLQFRNSFLKRHARNRNHINVQNMHYLFRQRFQRFRVTSIVSRLQTVCLSSLVMIENTTLWSVSPPTYSSVQLKTQQFRWWYIKLEISSDHLRSKKTKQDYVCLGTRWRANRYE